MYEKLFSECQIGKLTVKNRIVMEPMGHHLADWDGNTTDKVVNFYAERAKGGTGLIITEVVRVNDVHGKADGGQMSLASDERIPGMKNLAEAVHAYGGAVFVQLHHPGNQGFTALNGDVPMRTPSGIESGAVHQASRAMTVEEIHELEDDFAAAAKRAQEAGIDGVELHCAHGYLLNQFFSPYTNKREDEYGGCLENRVRIVKEIIEKIREKCGPDYPVIARVTVDEFLNVNGLNDGIHLDEGIEICRKLESYGIDALDISCGIYETMNVSWEPAGFDQGWKAYLAAGVKQAVKVPVFCTSVIRDPDYAEKLLEDGVCDFVGSARQQLADPEWAVKAKEGRACEIRKCISCLHCMETLFSADATGNDIQCAVNVSAAQEARWNSMAKDGDGRVVAIAGAGPAGLEAARVAAIRGFKPVIFEASGEIGGQLNLADKPPKKDKIQWLIDYYQSQIKKYDIEVRLNTPVTLEALKELNPVKVILAIGSHPAAPKSIPGLDGQNVLTVPDVLTDKVTFTGKNVCVIGSGLSGIETAEYLADKGNHITLYEMAEEIGPGIFFQNMIDIMGRLGPTGAELFPGHKLVKLEDNTAVFEAADGSEKVQPFDYAVISLGVVPNVPEAEIEAAFDTVKIGDCEAGGKIRHATEGGFEAAMAL